MSAVVEVICGRHDRPVVLGESRSVVVRDGTEELTREMAFGNAVTETKRAVRWTCPKCGTSWSRPWPVWRAACDALREAGTTRLDLADLRP